MSSYPPGVPPPTVVGQDYNRRRGLSPSLQGTSRPRKSRAEIDAERMAAAPAHINELLGQAKSTPSGALASRQEAAAERRESYPAATGSAKKAENDQAQSAAHAAARDRSPAGQPDNLPVRESTNTGAAGPRRTPTSMDVKPPWAEGIPLTKGGQPDTARFGEHGSMTVHSRPGGDPALKPGGFAHPSAQRDPLDALPEEGRMSYGPESVGGGHNWTLRTPGRQAAKVQRAEYDRQIRARQAQDEATVSSLDAQAAAATADIARSKELEQQPFAPEMGEIAGKVGAERAKNLYRTQRNEMASGLLSTYNENKLRILNDPSIEEAEKERLIQRAQQEYYMALAGLVGRDVTPRETPMMFGSLPPDEEA
jgi:hypothetical protein